jgi:putative peptide zinc metalloprotease protein
MSAAALLLGGAAPAAADGAQGGGADQVVTATTTAGNQTAQRSGLMAVPFGGDTLDNTNLARADAHDCTGCHSVAVSVQAVFAIGHPSVVTPHNFAVATNENCTGCVSYAYAYQYVLTTDGPVRLTTTGLEQIQSLRWQLAIAAASGLAPDALTTRLDELTTQFKTVIDQQLQAAGQSGQGSVQRQADHQAA